MNLVLCIDDKFVTYCSVLMVSILENNSDVNISFFIISKSISPKWKKRLSDIVNKYSKSIYYYTIEDDILKKCPVNGHISLATYYRLLIPLVLPSSIHKVIYMDCDMIVNSSLETVWNIDLEGYLIASVLECDSEVNASRLDYKPSLGYFNAGFFVLDLDLFRKCNFFPVLLDYINNNASVLKYWDQDVLNYNLKVNKKIISLKYNLQNTYLRSGIHIPDIYKKTYWKDIQNPVVVHFTGNLKPWHYCCKNPYKYLYLKYLKKANLGLCYYSLFYFKGNAYWIFRNILSSIGVVKPLLNNYINIDRV